MVVSLVALYFGAEWLVRGSSSLALRASISPLVVGLSAIVFPLQARVQLFKIDIPVMLVATILFTILFWDGTFGRLEGGLFFLGVVVYTSMSLYYSRKRKDTNDTVA